ncbi:hypothetical protein [Treponema primitia]|uniref:hypothetical protein n=1 Tax=Treponema primitia TaxID=88058 RepID=UPI0002555296|nr:hypothetical protein [Treponema primitia]
MGISVQKLRALYSILGFTLFLSSCSDMDTVFSSPFSSQGTYRVNALVDSDYTLDEYSVVNQNSKIRPFFVNSVVNDPDVRGLTVFVQDLSGTTISRKVRYVLSTDTQETKEVEEKEPQGSSGEVPRSPTQPLEESSPGEFASRPLVESDAALGVSPESLAGNTAGDKSPLTGNPAKNSSAEEKTDETVLPAQVTKKGGTDTVIAAETNSKAAEKSKTADAPVEPSSRPP